MKFKKTPAIFKGLHIVYLFYIFENNTNFQLKNIQIYFQIHSQVFECHYYKYLLYNCETNINVYGETVSREYITQVINITKIYNFHYTKKKTDIVQCWL